MEGCKPTHGFWESNLESEEVVSALPYWAPSPAPDLASLLMASKGLTWGFSDFSQLLFWILYKWLLFTIFDSLWQLKMTIGSHRLLYLNIWGPQLVVLFGEGTEPLEVQTLWWKTITGGGFWGLIASSHFRFEMVNLGFQPDYIWTQLKPKEVAHLQSIFLD